MGITNNVYLDTKIRGWWFTTSRLQRRRLCFPREARYKGRSVSQADEAYLTSNTIQMDAVNTGSVH
jgi:hypothetical protein